MVFILELLARQHEEWTIVRSRELDQRNAVHNRVTWAVAEQQHSCTTGTKLFCLKLHPESRCSSVNPQKVILPHRARLWICLDHAVAHRVDGQVLAEVEIGAELLIQAMDPTEIDVLVERVLQQAFHLQSIMQQLAKQVAPTHEEWVPWKRRQKPTLREIFVVEGLRAIVRVVEHTSLLAPGCDLVPTEAVEVRPAEDRHVHPNASIAGEQAEADGIGSSLVRGHLHEPIGQLGRRQILVHRGLLDDSHVPIRIGVLPSTYAQFEEIRHPIIALRPICPDRPRPHLAGQAPRWCRWHIVFGHRIRRHVAATKGRRARARGGRAPIKT
mmetsp:Transcript_1113/g.4636  ORF Transcript_1113/g.4636 Transcript_1113/m.4636 type:complete len:327 (+) Transcript_1113:418-1398(+)